MKINFKYENGIGEVTQEDGTPIKGVVSIDLHADGFQSFADLHMLPNHIVIKGAETKIVHGDSEFEIILNGSDVLKSLSEELADEIRYEIQTALDKYLPQLLGIKITDENS